MRATSGARTGFLAIATMVGFQLVLAAACDSSSRAIRIPITDQNRAGLSTSFSVPRTAVYAVGLEFSKPISDAEVDHLVDLAASKIGFPDPPTFDFTWRVLEGAAMIGQGPGEDGATGIVITGDGMGGRSWGRTLNKRDETVGSDRLNAMALLFGTFDACAGRTYTLHFSPGPALTRVLRTSPVILIDIHSTLEADGRIHDDGARLKRGCQTAAQHRPAADDGR